VIVISVSVGQYLTYSSTIKSHLHVLNAHVTPLKRNDVYLRVIAHQQYRGVAGNFSRKGGGRPKHTTYFSPWLKILKWWILTYHWICENLIGHPQGHREFPFRNHKIPPATVWNSRFPWRVWRGPQTLQKCGILMGDESDEVRKRKATQSDM